LGSGPPELEIADIGSWTRPTTLWRIMRPRKTLQQIAIGLGMTTLGCFVARLHLHIFDRLFLRNGRVR
jgi:hypothetical protein